MFGVDGNNTIEDTCRLLCTERALPTKGRDHKVSKSVNAIISAALSIGSMMEMPEPVRDGEVRRTSACSEYSRGRLTVRRMLRPHRPLNIDGDTCLPNYVSSLITGNNLVAQGF
jgi:hypothetical protein